MRVLPQEGAKTVDGLKALLDENRVKFGKAIRKRRVCGLYRAPKRLRPRARGEALHLQVDAGNRERSRRLAHPLCVFEQRQDLGVVELDDQASLGYCNGSLAPSPLFRLPAFMKSGLERNDVEPVSLVKVSHETNLPG